MIFENCNYARRLKVAVVGATIEEYMFTDF